MACFHGLLWISEVLDFHAVESQYNMRIKESLLNLASRFIRGRQLSIYFLGWGHYLSPPSCLTRPLLPLESIPTLQLYIFRAVRFFQRNFYVPIRELIIETLLVICIDSKVLALVVPGLV